MSVPTEQWAQVCTKKGGPVEYKKIPVAKPGPDEVLINVKYSGVCHTDLHAVNGDWPLPPKMPLVGGHEGAGVVVAKGDLAEGIEVGDHAGIKASCRISPSVLFYYSSSNRRACILFQMISTSLVTTRLADDSSHSGSMALACHATSASNQMSHCVPRHFCPDTRWMAPSNNTPLPRQHTSRI